MNFKIASFLIKSDDIQYYDTDLLDFSDTNVIYSANNSTGKTTLLRAVAYSLGFDIFGTRSINFPRLSFQTKIYNQTGEHCLSRKGLLFYFDDQKFNLAIQRNDVLRLVFSLPNAKDELIDSLLGTFYFDQEYGWMMGDEGKVFSKVSFAQDDFLYGLSKDDLSPEKKELKSKELLIEQLRSMKALSPIKEAGAIAASPELFKPETDFDVMEKRLQALNYDLRTLYREKGRLIETLKSNRELSYLVNNMKIVIKYKGKFIPVDETNMLNFPLDQSVIKKTLQLKEQDIATKEKEKKGIENSLSLLPNEEIKKMVTGYNLLVEEASKNISTISGTLIETQKACKVIKNGIHNAIIVSSPSKRLNELLFSKASSLGHLSLLNKENPLIGYDKGRISGAMLHILSYIFKTSYVELVKEYTGIDLPLFVDSPNGRELDEHSIQVIMNDLSSLSKEHQIFVASIHDRSETFPNRKLIELNGHYFDFQIKNKLW
jgi:hypothetical protein